MTAPRAVALLGAAAITVSLAGCPGPSTGETPAASTVPATAGGGSTGADVPTETADPDSGENPSDAAPLDATPLGAAEAPPSATPFAVIAAPGAPLFGPGPGAAAGAAREAAAGGDDDGVGDDAGPEGAHGAPMLGSLWLAGGAGDRAATEARLERALAAGRAPTRGETRPADIANAAPLDAPLVGRGAVRAAVVVARAPAALAGDVELAEGERLVVVACQVEALLPAPVPRAVVVCVDAGAPPGATDGAALAGTLRAGLTALAAALGPRDRLTIVVAGESVTVPVRGLTPANPEHAARIEGAIAVVVVGGDGESLAAAFARAATIAREERGPARPARLLLITRREPGADVATTVVAAAADGVATSAVGIGLDRDHEALAALAVRGAGAAAVVPEEPAALERILGLDLAGLLVPVAIGLRVRLDHPASWRPVRPEPGEAAAPASEASAVPAVTLFAGERRVSLIELAVPAEELHAEPAAGLLRVTIGYTPAGRRATDDPVEPVAEETMHVVAQRLARTDAALLGPLLADALGRTLDGETVAAARGLIAAAEGSEDARTRRLAGLLEQLLAVGR